MSLEFLIKIPIKRNITLLLKALRKERPTMFPKMGPLWKQMPISRALVSISFGVPSKGAVPMKCRENIQSPSTGPTQMEDPHTVGCSLVPQGDHL